MKKLIMSLSMAVLLFSGCTELEHVPDYESSAISDSVLVDGILYTDADQYGEIGSYWHPTNSFGWFPKTATYQPDHMDVLVRTEKRDPPIFLKEYFGNKLWKQVDSNDFDYKSEHAAIKNVRLLGQSPSSSNYIVSETESLTSWKKTLNGVDTQYIESPDFDLYTCVAVISIEFNEYPAYFDVGELYTDQKSWYYFAYHESGLGLAQINNSTLIRTLNDLFAPQK